MARRVRELAQGEGKPHSRAWRRRRGHATALRRCPVAVRHAARGSVRWNVCDAKDAARAHHCCRRFRRSEPCVCVGVWLAWVCMACPRWVCGMYPYVRACVRARVRVCVGVGVC